MSKRAKIQEQLSAYLDGELAPAEHRKVEEALGADASLSQELGELRAVRELLGGIPRANAPDDLAESILREAERASLVGSPAVPQSGGRLRWLRYTGVAAALVLAVCVGAMIVSQLSDADRSLEPLAFKEAADEMMREQLANAREVAALEEATSAPGRDAAEGADVVAGLPALAASTPSMDVPSMEVPGVEVAMADSVVIYTRDLESTRRNVEELLLSNAVRPAPTTEFGFHEAPTTTQANVYVAARDTEAQVQWIVYATDEQIEQIQSQLLPVQSGEGSPPDSPTLRVERDNKARIGLAYREEEAPKPDVAMGPGPREELKALGGADARDRGRSTERVPSAAPPMARGTRARRMAPGDAGVGGETAGRSVAGRVTGADAPTARIRIHTEAESARADTAVPVRSLPDSLVVASQADTQPHTQPASQPTSQPVLGSWLGQQLASLGRKGFELLDASARRRGVASQPSDTTRTLARNAPEPTPSTSHAGRAFGLRRALRAAVAANRKAAPQRPLLITLNRLGRKVEGVKAKSSEILIPRGKSLIPESTPAPNPTKRP
jgi:anti-sigma factor RsiW